MLYESTAKCGSDGVPSVIAVDESADDGLFMTADADTGIEADQESGNQRDRRGTRSATVSLRNVSVLDAACSHRATA